MKNIVLTAVACGTLLMGCGGKVEEFKRNIDNAEKAVDAANKASEQMEQGADEAKKMYEERRSKGDTVAMPYKDLEAYLPAPIAGFKADGGPSGAQQSMPGYSVSTAQQKWVSDGADGKHADLTIMDYGGTETGFGPMMMGIGVMPEVEDDHQKVSKLKSDVPMTTGVVTYNKESHDVSIVAGSRYRYWLAINIQGATDDQTQAAVDAVNDMAKKLEGK